MTRSSDDAPLPLAQAEFDYVTLGCGVAGMSTAKLLTDAGARNILILDEYEAPGGSQKSTDLNGYTFDIGAFYYWDTMPFFEMFPEVRSQCERTHISVQRITPGRFVSAYPFSIEQEVIARGPLYWLQVAASSLIARLCIDKMASAESYAKFFMGERLYHDLGMGTYLQRFYGVPPDQIEPQFAVSRMEQVVKLGSAAHWWNIVSKKFRRKVLRQPLPLPNQDLLVRPRAGFKAMYDPAVESLTNAGVTIQLGVALSAIRKDGDCFVLEGPGFSIRTAKLVSTVPIDRLCRLLSLSVGSDVSSSSLFTLYVSFAGKRAFSSPILYNFGAAGRWKRLTMHSDYYGKVAGREYFSVEIPSMDASPQSAQVMFESFCESCRQYGIFAGDLRLEGADSFKNAYPAHILGTTERLDVAMRELDALGINMVGRQGRFDYLPTGMHVVNQVRQHLTGPTTPD